MAVIDKSTDTKVQVTAADTTPSVLDSKVMGGAGLTKTVLNPAANENLQLNVVANADGSIVVNPTDVQVGVLATDAQHGTRGGGTLHAAATSAVDGFMQGADKAKLDALITNGASIPYVQGRAGEIVSNFSAFEGDNSNFSSYVLDQAITPGLLGAFSFTGYYPGIVLNDEFIPVDPNRLYELSGYYRQESVPGDWSAYSQADRHLFYAGLYQYDADKLGISAWHHMYQPGTATTLAAALNPGDLTIQLVSAAGWYDVADSKYWLRSLAVMEYSNSFGHLYDDYTRYSYLNLWAGGGSIDFATSIITLSVPWAGPAFPAGSRVRNATTGGSFKYSMASGQVPPATDTWYKMRGWAGGIDRSGTNKTLNFTPGVAYVKWFTLPLYSNRDGGYLTYAPTGPTTRCWFAGITVKERTDGYLYSRADGYKDIYIPAVTVAAPGDATATSVQTLHTIPDVLAVV